VGRKASINLKMPPRNRKRWTVNSLYGNKQI